MDSEKIIERLQKHGIRPTVNRILVMRTLAKQHHPVSMTELEDIIDTMDKSSIFRVLTLCLEHDLIHSIEDGSGVTKYEVCHGEHSHSIHDQHIHFHCEVCNRTFCFDSIPIPLVELPSGYEIRNINYIIKGVCTNCSR